MRLGMLLVVIENGQTSPLAHNFGKRLKQNNITIWTLGGRFRVALNILQLFFNILYISCLSSHYNCWFIIRFKKNLDLQVMKR